LELPLGNDSDNINDNDSDNECAGTFVESTTTLLQTRDGGGILNTGKFGYGEVAFEVVGEDDGDVDCVVSA